MWLLILGGIKVNPCQEKELQRKEPINHIWKLWIDLHALIWCWIIVLKLQIWYRHENFQGFGCTYRLLSHPSLWWLYVFSSFPPPRPRPPPPPPQWLLLLTSKPFELHLRYLGQRKYRSGKMYWMTFRWHWLKVTAVTLINKNLLVCRIKWEPLNQSLQNLVAISPWSWLSPD